MSKMGTRGCHRTKHLILLGAKESIIAFSSEPPNGIGTGFGPPSLMHRPAADWSLASCGNGSILYFSGWTLWTQMLPPQHAAIGSKVTICGAAKRVRPRAPCRALKSRCGTGSVIGQIIKLRGSTSCSWISCATREAASIRTPVSAFECCSMPYCPYSVSAGYLPDAGGEQRSLRVHSQTTARRSSRRLTAERKDVVITTFRTYSSPSRITLGSRFEVVTQGVRPRLDSIQDD